MNRPHQKLNRYVKSFIYSFISTKFVTHIYIEFFLPMSKTDTNDHRYLVSLAPDG